MNANAFEIYYLRTVKAARDWASKADRESDREREGERHTHTHCVYLSKAFRADFSGLSSSHSNFLALQIEFYFDFFWAQLE